MKKNLAVFALLFGWTISVADTDVDTQFFGTWVLQEIQTQTDNGEWVENEVLGQNPFGILMYDGIGNMAVQIARRNRSTPVEKEAVEEIINGYVAYTATYDVDASASTVTHHRKSHINADLGQLTVVRFYEFDGDTLILTVAPERELRLKWIRLKTKIQTP
jgi:hypothetical protein